MTDAVIVATARTPIGKAHRGALNLTGGADLAAHAIRHALDRAGVEPGAVEEVVIGCGYPEAATGGNVARHASLVAGIPVRRPALRSRASAPRASRPSRMPPSASGSTACRSRWRAASSRSASSSRR